MLEKPEYGGVGVHVLLALLTAGIGNIIYAAVKFGGREKVALRVDVKK
jgi:hypothetical protein